MKLQETHDNASRLIREALQTIAGNQYGTDQSNIDTPERIAKYWMELFNAPQEPETTEDLILDATNERFRLTKFNSHYSGLLVEKDLTFTSACEHHLLPIFGTCHIGYINSGTVLGLSKLARAVKCITQKPQTQENMTEDLGNYFIRVLKPKFFGIHIEATHTCMSARGVKEVGAKTVTSFFYPSDQDTTKQEFLQAIS